MIKLYSWIICITLGALAQENALHSIPSSILECYDNPYLHEKDNRLPHTLNTLIAILRKIENTKDLNVNLQSLTVGIMHRFRLDGIEENPSILKKSGISPYRMNFDHGAKFLQILRFIPEKIQIPYDIISDIERCTLHFMLSSSIEMFERDDEGTVCRVTDDMYYRKTRSVNSNHSANTNTNIHDVETLTPEQINIIKNHKNEVTENTIDPNALYPELPPNHPEIARIVQLPSLSQCPVENGVIKTNWGAVSIGSVISGIAAGLQPEIVKLSELFLNKVKTKPSLSELLLSNKWIATLAGDLAEVTLLQGPLMADKEKLSVGVNGNWNSSFVPRWYFLKSNEHLEFTTAEIRGTLDGLIIANQIETLYSRIPNLKLSQILDLYYGAHGLFNSSIRACDRRTLFTSVAPNQTMSAEAFSAALVLREYFNKATMDEEVIKDFAVAATNKLSVYIPSSMNNDLSCRDTETGHFNDSIQFSVDLKIILDTTWPFEVIQPILANLLDNMKINPYNSQFMIINAHDGKTLINTTSSILDFGYYNISNYINVTSGFDLAASLKTLKSIQIRKLNDERNGLGGAKSDVVLIIPYLSTVPDADKEFCMQEIKWMNEQIPDTTILILSYKSKDDWADYVKNPTTDLFYTSSTDSRETSSAVFSLVSRIKQVPERLINTQCGANYSPTSRLSNSFIDYIEPSTTVLYRMHPNYFFSTDSSHRSTIRVKGSGWGTLNVCTSQQFSENIMQGASCTSINNDEHVFSFSCDEASTINFCRPLYLSVTANSSITSYECRDIDSCRFPHMVQYTISYEQLVCESSANINLFNIILLIISMIYVFL